MFVCLQDSMLRHCPFTPNAPRGWSSLHVRSLVVICRFEQLEWKCAACVDFQLQSPTIQWLPKRCRRDKSALTRLTSPATIQSSLTHTPTSKLPWVKSHILRNNEKTHFLANLLALFYWNCATEINMTGSYIIAQFFFSIKKKLVRGETMDDNWNLCTYEKKLFEGHITQPYRKVQKVAVMHAVALVSFLTLSRPPLIWPARVVLFADISGACVGLPGGPRESGDSEAGRGASAHALHGQDQQNPEPLQRRHHHLPP